MHIDVTVTAYGIPGAHKGKGKERPTGYSRLQHSSSCNVNSYACHLKPQHTHRTDYCGCAQRMCLSGNMHKNLTWPKHQRALDMPITETQPNSNITKLQDVCRTRWIQRNHPLFQLLVVTKGMCSDSPNL